MEVNEPIAHYGSLDLDKSYTYLDYLRFTFTERVELIKGRLLKMSPAPNLSHQNSVANLYTIFGVHFKGKSCKWFPAPFDVRLNIHNSTKDTTVVQPDMCVVCDTTILDAAGCNGTPDLMLEILSPSNRKHDLETKFDLYEEAQVKEYWIVDPIARTVLVYQLVENNYRGLRPFGEGSQVISPLFPDLEIHVDDIFEGLE